MCAANFSMLPFLTLPHADAGLRRRRRRPGCRFTPWTTRANPPSLGRRTPSSTATPLPFPVIRGVNMQGQGVARRRSGASSTSPSLAILTSSHQASNPSAHHHLRPRKRVQDRREDRSQRPKNCPPHVDVVPRPPALRHRRSRAALQRSRVRSTPFPPPVVVPSHAAAIFAFDAGRLYALSDASDVAQIDPLNVLVALLALLAATLIEPRWCVPYNES